jgi:hypothetical protein
MAIPEAKEHRMDTPQTPRRRRRGVLAIGGSALALAVAVPVGGALAGDGGTGSGDRSGSGASSPTLPIQEQRPDGRQRPGSGRDCPEKDGGAQGGSGQQPTPDDQQQL